MVQSAELYNRYDDASAVNGSSQQCIFAQSEMGPVGIMVIRIAAMQPTQVGFACYEHLVQQLSPDRSYDTLDIPILPRPSWCNGSVPDTHGRQSFCTAWPYAPSRSLIRYCGAVSQGKASLI